MVSGQEVFSKAGDPVNRWGLVQWGLTASFLLNRSNVVEAVGEGPKRGLTQCSKRVPQICLVNEAVSVLIHDGECLEAQEEGREHRESCQPLQRLWYPAPPALRLAWDRVTLSLARGGALGVLTRRGSNDLIQQQSWLPCPWAVRADSFLRQPKP